MPALPPINLDFVAALALAALITKGFEFAVERWGLQRYVLALLGLAAIAFAAVPQFFEDATWWGRPFFVAIGIGAIALWAYRHADDSAIPLRNG